jgi:RNA polymerase sigma-70 factor (ECF subfamily)
MLVVYKARKSRSMRAPPYFGCAHGQATVALRLTAGWRAGRERMSVLTDRAWCHSNGLVMTLPRHPREEDHEPGRGAGRIVARQRTSAEAAEFEAMFRAHYAPVCGYVRRLVGTMAVAEEIAQEVFARIWERQETFAFVNARTFLLVAAKRLALNHLRMDQVRARWRAGEESAEHPVAASAEGAVEQDDLAVAVRRAVERLPARTRAVYRLHREAGMTYREIALELGVSIKTVDGQMARALRILRVSLAGYFTVVAAVLIGQ